LPAFKGLKRSAAASAGAFEAALKRLKPAAAASTRHSGHGYLGLPQPSATITAFEPAVARLESLKMLRSSFEQARRPQPLLLSSFEAAVCSPSKA
jgi:hypothetical protein